MMQPPPSFTIIVPTLNSEDTISRTLESIQIQTCDDFEVIICDGSSKDKTLTIIASHQSKMPSLRIDSCIDNGIYEAINRGVRSAHGKWVLVLGSDDRIHKPETLATALSMLSEENANVIYGDVRICGNSALMRDGERYCGPVKLRDLVNRNICQQAIFYRREALLRAGIFKPRYRICADWDHALRTYISHRPKWIDLIVSDYNASGLSSRSRDYVFERSKPMTLLRTCLSRPLDAEAIGIRWTLRAMSAGLWQQSRRTQSIALITGWLILGLASRFCTLLALVRPPPPSSPQ